MAALSFRPASELSDPEMGALFTRGYQGYYTPIALDGAAFRSMVDTNDIDPSASRVGWMGSEPVAFAMLGVRGARGWIGGMGVVPEARGQGFGRAVMEAVLDVARARPLASVDLEVLEQNQPAARIYEALGFADRRWVDVLVRPPAPLPPAPGPARTVLELQVAECLELHAEAHSGRPPWQRDLPSLVHWAPRLRALGERDGDRPVAWVIYRVDGSRLNLADVARVVGASPARLEDALRSLIAAHPECTLTLVNLPADDPAGNTLRRLGATAKFRQREMTLAL